jgi:hypothetical protein
VSRRRAAPLGSAACDAGLQPRRRLDISHPLAARTASLQDEKQRIKKSKSTPFTLLKLYERASYFWVEGATLAMLRVLTQPALSHHALYFPVSLPPPRAIRGIPQHTHTHTYTTRSGAIASSRYRDQHACLPVRRRYCTRVTKPWAETADNGNAREHGSNTNPCFSAPDAGSLPRFPIRDGAVHIGHDRVLERERERAELQNNGPIGGTIPAR